MNTVALVILLALAFLFLSAMRIWNRFAVGFETKSRGEIEREREIARERAARGETPLPIAPSKPGPARRHPGATVIRRDPAKATERRDA